MTQLNGRLLICLLLWAPAAMAQAADNPPEKPIPVLAAEVVRQSLADRVEALGTLKANESVVITANVTETISRLHFEDGQRVRAGDLLVEMTNAEEHALLEEARVRAGEAERQYQRVKALVAQRSASESLLDERKRDLDTAHAILVALESRLADRVILAPFDGVLGFRDVSRGALVEPGDPITTLDDDRLMKLDFAVPSVHLPSLVPGLRIEARTSAHGERVFTGVVRGIDSRIDPVTRTAQVRAILPNPERQLKPGLLMRIDLLVDPREGLVIPEKALLHQGQEHFVLALSDGKEGPTAQRRQVEIGTRQPGWVEIRAGLQPGERVVTDGNDKVRPGQPLRILDAIGGDGTRNPPAVTDAAP
ncbi:efflux RND transporter periplasmic adaptor subunit [Thiocystis violascens]|nr:efflux RND transporter periplasmic adaptor subunit [Thiocystis violascens]